MAEEIHLRACLAVTQAGRILLVPHYQTDAGPVQWILPGGQVRFGEPLESAAVREFLEEAGLLVEIDGLLDVSEVIWPQRPWHSVTVTYSGHVLGGELAAEPDHPYGAKEPRWFSPEELVGVPYHPRRPIERALEIQDSAGQAEFDALLRFLPLFEQPGRAFVAHWAGAQPTADGLISAPYPVYDDDVLAFFSLAGQPFWSDTDYEPAQAGRMLADAELIRGANLAQIKTMLTHCVRGERFCDGHWAEMLTSGKVVALLRRLNELRNARAMDTGLLFWPGEGQS